MDLPKSPITYLNYCTSAQGVFNNGATASLMHEAVATYGKVCDAKSLALFFHGGLVDKADAFSTAQQLIGPYQAPGFDGGNAYPYFFIWESGIWEILEQRLPAILGDAVFRWLVDIVSAKIREVRSHGPGDNALSPAELQGIVHTIEEGPSSEVIDATKRTIILGGIANVIASILRREATGHDHGMPNTVVEELLRAFFLGEVGASIWTAMKDSTARAFLPDPERYVGTAMIKELVALYESGQAGKNARITLIGHSAGAVYISNFLKAMTMTLQGKTYADSIRFDVILMAPAARVDLFADTLFAYGTLIRNCRIYEMSVALESTDILVDEPVIRDLYTSSLLYFISGVLEDPDGDTPILGMKRYFTGKKPFAPGQVRSIDTVSAFYSQHSHATVCSDTKSDDPQPPLGQRCTSHHHGGFPIDPGTLQSVCYLLRTGMYT
jgi:hypothetical protein